MTTPETPTQVADRINTVLREFNGPHWCVDDTDLQELLRAAERAIRAQADRIQTLNQTRTFYKDRSRTAEQERERMEGRLWVERRKNTVAVNRLIDAIAALKHTQEDTPMTFLEGVTLSHEDARTTLRLLVAHANATESIEAAQICGKLRDALGVVPDQSESASWEERMQMEPPVVNGMRLFWAQEDSEVYCGRTLEDVRAFVEKLIGEPLPDDQIGEVTHNSKFTNEDGSETTLFEAFVAENLIKPTQISTHYY